MMDSISIFRFQATQQEIDTFVRNAQMHQVKHDGTTIYWPHFSHPYWFQPRYSPSNKLYRDLKNTSNLKVLYYETKSHTAYFVNFET
jgi:hypothetical protein